MNHSQYKIASIRNNWKWFICCYNLVNSRHGLLDEIDAYLGVIVLPDRHK